MSDAYRQHEDERARDDEAADKRERQDRLDRQREKADVAALRETGWETERYPLSDLHRRREDSRA